MADGTDNAYDADTQRQRQMSNLISQIGDQSPDIKNQFDDTYASTDGWTGYKKGMDSYAKQAQPKNVEAYQKMRDTLGSITDSLTSIVQGTEESWKNSEKTQSDVSDSIRDQAGLGNAVDGGSTSTGGHSGKH